MKALWSTPWTKPWCGPGCTSLVEGSKGRESPLVDGVQGRAEVSPGHGVFRGSSRAPLNGGAAARRLRVMKRRYVSLALIRLDAGKRQQAGVSNRGAATEPPFGKMVLYYNTHLAGRVRRSVAEHNRERDGCTEVCHSRRCRMMVAWVGPQRQ